MCRTEIHFSPGQKRASHQAKFLRPVGQIGQSRETSPLGGRGRIPGGRGGLAPPGCPAGLDVARPRARQVRQGTAAARCTGSTPCDRLFARRFTLFAVLPAQAAGLNTRGAPVGRASFSSAVFPTHAEDLNACGAPVSRASSSSAVLPAQTAECGACGAPVSRASSSSAVLPAQTAECGACGALVDRTDCPSAVFPAQTAALRTRGAPVDRAGLFPLGGHDYHAPDGNSILTR